MEGAVLFFLSSGLFLGWSLGANDAANVFGTAVGARMVRFATAAAICSIFVVLGAVLSGAGAAQTLGRLGAVNALGGSFMAACAAAIAVYLMTKAGLPVSTTQAIVGSIIGWNFFSQTPTDASTLATILSTWIICPLLAAVFAALLFKLTNWTIRKVKPHLLYLDAYTRVGLLLAGAFGAYSLGANNIANVMGVFVPVSPFTDFDLGALGTISSVEQLFLLGALAIAVGVVTYSKGVMLTVGGRLLPLSPVAAWVAVVAHSLVLFLFASEGLESLLASLGLPTIPLVPVSSSQAVVGAVIGIGLLKGGRGIRWRVLGRIGLGWMVTPLIAGAICFIGLYFLQNVFNQEVYRATRYRLTSEVVERLARDGLDVGSLANREGQSFATGVALKEVLSESGIGEPEAVAKILRFAEVKDIYVDPAKFPRLDRVNLGDAEKNAVIRLAGRHFSHSWMFAEALAGQSDAWRLKNATTVNKVYNKEIMRRLALLERFFTSER